jgi:hypothetical protein
MIISSELLFSMTRKLVKVEPFSTATLSFSKWIWISFFPAQRPTKSAEEQIQKIRLFFLALISIFHSVVSRLNFKI